MRIRRLVILGLPAILRMAVIFFLSAQTDPLGVASSRALAVAAHLGEYALLAVLLLWPQLSAGGTLRKGALAPATSFAVALLYGASDEFHQGFVPGREASWIDLGLDAAGAAAAIIVVGCCGHAARLRSTLFPSAR